jgi:hypothetical protein
VAPAPGDLTTPPYEPTIREGKLYASGTKQFIQELIENVEVFSLKLYSETDV